MEIRILGPLEVLEGGRALELGGAKQRALLAMLALQPNRAVSLDRLVRAVWDDDPPESARKALQVYVSQLRKALGHDRLQTKGGGYLLRIERDELDLSRFERLRESGELEAALALWRGEPLSGLDDHEFARTESARLQELRLSCLEQRIERDLVAGRHTELVGELEALVQAHPHREHLRAQLMLALYRSGRQAEALEAYQAARAELVAELGLDPGPALRELHQQILRHDHALDIPLHRRPGGAQPADAPPRAESPPMRKTVTVLFCSLAGSDELGERRDPEALRAVMRRWYDAMRGPLEQAEGSIEKLVGDSVIAVFGVPATHEDDAFRAVQAAIEMRKAAARLELPVRIGVNTGEVVTGDAESALVTGDAVNIAKRLEEAASPDEILIGPATRLLVANATELEPAHAVSVHGKRAPMQAWRVLSTIPGAAPFARRLDTRLVGRTNELALLQAELGAAMHENECRVVTVHGSAGIGKSRLVKELLAGVETRVRILKTRCVPYGDGITFLPLRELLADVSSEHVIAEGSNEEIFLSVRRLLAELAAQRPLLVCLDDIHWAQPAFLDLIEYLAGWILDAPILLVCLTRPELYDERPRWPGIAVGLDALTDEEASELLDELAAEWPLTPGARAQIRDVAEGNPLYLEQLVAMLAEGEADAMPPTINALLAARLDRLEPVELAVLQRAAVAGRDFSRGAVVELSPGDERSDVGATLLSLVRKELVRPARSEFADEDGFRFRHALIRDAAYGEIPKRTRVDLHERFASWLEARDATPELVGYHLEQAYRFGVELGTPDEMLGRRSGELLADAGRRAYARDDVRAAVNLLQRASTLLRDDDATRAEVLILLGSALMSGGGFAEGRTALEEARDIATEVGERRLEIRAAIELAFHTALTGSARSSAEIVAIAEQAIPALLELHDDAGLSRAWRLISEAHVLACRWADRAEALERALHYAQQAGDRRQQSSIVALLAQALHYGPTPAEEAIDRCDSLLADTDGDSALGAALMSTLGGLYAMRGDSERAHSLWGRSKELYERLGLQHRRAARSLIGANIELLAGDPAAAERELRLGYDTLASMGETWVRATLAAYLAAALVEIGRDDEAIAFTQESEANAAADDVVTQVVWRGARARALARRDPDDAACLARDAVERASETDFLDLRAGALLDLAVVSGDAESAALAADEYERKGNIVGAARARALVAV